MKFNIVKHTATISVIIIIFSEILMIHSVHAVNKKDLNYKNDDVDINKYNNENVNFAESTNIEITAVSDWPNKKIKFGHVSGVSLDTFGNVYVFHRDNRVWDMNSFFPNNTFTEADLGPISNPTVAVIHPKSGELIIQWGQNMFYLPHGITVDFENNVWITDVAMHQVFKFSPLMKSQSSKIPILSLGTKFLPGSSLSLFCKPTAVAVLPSGEFFVSDGYCNSRIIKFAPDGTVLLTWGRSTLTSGILVPEYHFSVPHDLTIAEDKNLVCVSDRENGRIQCFLMTNGSFIFQIQSPEIGFRVFSASYTPANGGLFFVVNGLEPGKFSNVVHGSVVDFNWDRFNVIKRFQPANTNFETPHDVCVSQNGTELYVTELNSKRIWKFQIGNVHRNSVQISDLLTSSHIQSQPDDESPNTILMAVFITAVVICFAAVLLAAAVIYSKARTRGRSRSLEDLLYDTKNIYN